MQKAKSMLFAFLLNRVPFLLFTCVALKFSC